MPLQGGRWLTLPREVATLHVSLGINCRCLVIWVSDIHVVLYVVIYTGRSRSVPPGERTRKHEDDDDGKSFHLERKSQEREAEFIWEDTGDD